MIHPCEHVNCQGIRSDAPSTLLIYISSNHRTTICKTGCPGKANICQCSWKWRHPLHQGSVCSVERMGQLGALNVLIGQSSAQTVALIHMRSVPSIGFRGGLEASLRTSLFAWWTQCLRLKEYWQAAFENEKTLTLCVFLL